MRLNEVIQFRVSTEEKAELQGRAEGHGLSHLIREALGLSVGKAATPVATAPPKPKKPSPPAEKPEPSGPTGEEIEAEARRIFYSEGETMVVARRLAKERLSAS